MKKLISDIKSLKEGDVGVLVNKRIGEFKRLGRVPDGTRLRRKQRNEIFKELCFCLLTANYSAERAISIQEKIGDGFLTMSQKRLARALARLGYRYPNARAGYIILARKHKDSLVDYVRGFTPHIARACPERGRREWLVKNIKGLGYKEASHFLRNIGYDNLAIIDFHIVDLLLRHKLATRPKTLTKAKYFEVEKILVKIAKTSSLTLAELDLYLWYIETGKILK